MKLKIFTLRLDSATGKFDDKELTGFQEGKDVIELSEHFLVHEKTPTLTLVLRYRELPDGPQSSPEAARKDWRAELDEPGKRLYDELRLWRGRKAKREGMPPYLILNNRELAELAMKRPASLAQLREIDGIGDAKSARWGEEIIALLMKMGEAQTPENHGPSMEVDLLHLDSVRVPCLPAGRRLPVPPPARIGNSTLFPSVGSKSYTDAAEMRPNRVMRVRHGFAYGSNHFRAGPLCGRPCLIMRVSVGRSVPCVQAVRP